MNEAQHLAQLARERDECIPWISVAYFPREMVLFFLAEWDAAWQTQEWVKRHASAD